MIWMVILVSLITMCAADKDDSIILSSLTNSNSYSRKHHIHDFPSNKFGFKHQHSTAVSPQDTIYQNIQYAPLYGRITPKTNQNYHTDYTMFTPTLSSEPSPATEASNIEPYRHWKKHLESSKSNNLVKDPTEIAKCAIYSTDRNEEVMSTVSRSPGHNAIYRSYVDPANGNKLFQMSYLTPLDIYKKFKEIPTTMLPTLQLNRKKNPYNQLYVLNPNMISNDSPVVPKMKRQFSQGGKIHRLHLNIARVYSPGQVPEKSPVFADTFSLNVRGSPAHSQPIVPPLIRSLGDQNTILYPKRNFAEKKFPFRML